jgi:hypothetical protein
MASLTMYEKYEGRIPPHTLETLRNYIEYGVPTGGFLHSVLTDSLFGAYGKADSENREALGDIVMFVYNEAPNNCWGSRDHVKAWCEKEGRQGRDARLRRNSGFTVVSVSQHRRERERQTPPPPD